MSPADMERLVRVVGEEARGAFIAGTLDLRALRAGVRRRLREEAAEMGCGAAGVGVDARQVDWLAGAGAGAAGGEGAVSE